MAIHMGQWQTVAKIESADGAHAAQLLLQQGSGAIDFADKNAGKENTIGFLLRSRLNKARSSDASAHLCLLKQDLSTLDATHWPEDELQAWVEMRRRDFLSGVVG